MTSTPDLQHAHAVAVKYHGPGNVQGSRVSLTSLRYERDRVYLPYDHAEGSPVRQATAWLHRHGLAPFATADTPAGYVVLCTTFQRLDGKPRGY
jgi:hypothetical protein